MRYLIGFNESADNIQNIIDDLGDILLDFSDGGYCHNVSKKRGGSAIEIEIGYGLKMIDLHQFGDTLMRLMDYMESAGWKLSNESYFINYDPEMICPECGDFSIDSFCGDEGEYLGVCRCCRYEDYIHKFENFEHSLNKKDIILFIENKYKVEYLNLTFVKGS